MRLATLGFLSSTALALILTASACADHPALVKSGSFGRVSSAITPVSASPNWTVQLPSTGTDTTTGTTVDSNGYTYAVGSTSGVIKEEGPSSAGGTDAYIALYQGGTLNGVVQFGTTGNESATGVAADHAGYVYVTGSTTGSLFAPNKGKSDFFLAQFDIEGNIDWSVQDGTPGADQSNAVATDGQNNIFIGGYASKALEGNNHYGAEDGFVQKFNSAGLLQWSHQFGSTGDEVVTGLAADLAGDVFVVGTTTDAFGGQPYQGGAHDYFVARYDPSGFRQWVIIAGSAGDDIATGVAVDNAGNVTVTGTTTGNLFNTNQGGTDLFVASFHATNGKSAWAEQLGTPYDDDATAVAVDSTGLIYVTGHTGGTLPAANIGGGSDVFVMRLDNKGNLQQTRQFTGTWPNHSASAHFVAGNSITVSSTSLYIGGIEPVGTFEGLTSTTASQGFVMGMCTAGNFSCPFAGTCHTNNGGCPTNSACNAQGGGYISCTCRNGFSGNADCIEANECAPAGVCGSPSVATGCINSVGSFTCSCTTGNANQGKSTPCVDACNVNNGGCGAPGTCSHDGVTNAVVCNCPGGYNLDADGVTCDPIDNCGTGVGGCDLNATCADTGPGTNSCTCNAGFTTFGTACEYTASLYSGVSGTDGTTGEDAFNDDQNFDDGTLFQVSTAGTAWGMSYYRGPNFTTQRTGHLWDSSGNLLAQVTFTGVETAWHTAYFSSPVSLAAGTYTVSVDSYDGFVHIKNGFFNSAAVVDGPVTYPKNTGSTPNGVMSTAAESFPNQGTNAFEFVDVVFQPTDPCAADNGGCRQDMTCASTGAGTDSCSCGAGTFDNGTSCQSIGVTNGQVVFDVSQALNGGIEDASFELGNQFTPADDGNAVGVRYYRAAGMTATRTGHLWDDSGDLLATVAFTGTTVGWHDAYFASPVAVSGGGNYIVSVDDLDGAALYSYVLDDGGDAGVLQYPLSSSLLGQAETYPTTQEGLSYYVDIDFQPADSCQANNGGCLDEATCTDTTAFANNCTCPMGMIGDGTVAGTGCTTPVP